MNPTLYDRYGYQLTDTDTPDIARFIHIDDYKRIRAEVEALQTKCDMLTYSERLFDEALGAAMAEVEALRPDAERWVAMRNQIISGEDPPESAHAVAKRYNDELTVECLNAFADAMIDAQRTASGGGEVRP